NGIGVLGGGGGGIEEEEGMLGKPSYCPVPEVSGAKRVGELPNGTTATDLALKVTQVLREKGVVSKSGEVLGQGVA
ncbi:aconitase family protein, partial [Bacillus atrophaeus]